MSTQAARSILFTHTSPQQGFRLLELTPELVELLSSKDAPVLELKSLSPSLSQTATEAGIRDDYVNLCTPTKTYRIRQVQSSNPLHLLRPSDGGVQRGDINMVGEEDDGLNLVDTVTCIAKSGSTLELHTPPEGFSATSFLERMLRLYDGDEDVEGDAEADADADAEQNRIIQRLFEDVPVSRVQCERGWIELCAFVFGRGADNDPTTCCWRPSAKVKLDVWKRAMEGAILQGIDLGKQFLVSDLWGSVLDDGEEPFPRPLFEAIIRRVCELEDGPGQLRAGAQVKWASIDKDNCIPWVGQTYLEAMAPTSNSAVGRSEFLNAWKNYLPESWRDEVALSKLTDGSYKYPDQTSICFVSEADRHKVKTNISTDASATAAKKSRNWHEVFKNQKRQKQ